MRTRVPSCPACGARTPAGARFCASCGRPLATGAGAARTRLRDPASLAALVLVAAGLALAAAGEPALGLLAFVGAAGVVAARLARSRGQSRPGFGELRARAAARSREQMELFRARRERADLEAERSRLFRDLGAAVYGGHESGMERARAALDAVAERLAAKEAEIDVMTQATQEPVERTRFETRSAVRMETPPEPARVPEPWPPPDEGDLPDPAPTPAPGEPAPGPNEPGPPLTPPTGGTGAETAR